MPACFSLDAAATQVLDFTRHRHADNEARMKHCTKTQDAPHRTPPPPFFEIMNTNPLNQRLAFSRWLLVMTFPLLPPSHSFDKSSTTNFSLAFPIFTCCPLSHR